MPLFHATLETVNFSFDAFAHTRARALSLMQAAWREHCRQYEMPFADTWEEWRNEVQVRQLRAGQVFRDREVLRVR